MSTWAKATYSSAGGNRPNFGVAIDVANNHVYSLESIGAGVIGLVRRFYDTGDIDLAVKITDTTTKPNFPEASAFSGPILLCDPGDSAEETALYFHYEQQDISGTNDYGFLVKVNGNGVIQWHKRFQNEPLSSPHQIAQDANNIYLTTLHNLGGIPQVNVYTYVHSFDKSTGAKNWTQYLGSDQFFQPTGLCIDENNSHGYVTGYKYSTSGAGTIYASKIVKFSTSTGAFVWGRMLSYNYSTNGVKIRHPRLDSDGDLYVCTERQPQVNGGTHSTSDSAQDQLQGSGIMKISSSGTMQWSYDYTNAMQITDMMILQSGDSGGEDQIVVTGRQVEAPNFSSVDGFEYHQVWGLDTLGTQQWAYQFDTTENLSYWNGDFESLSSHHMTLTSDVENNGFFITANFEPERPDGTNTDRTLAVTIRRNADGSDEWNTPLTGLWQGKGNTSYQSISTGTAYTLTYPYSLSTFTSGWGSYSMIVSNHVVATTSTDTDAVDYTINRYIQLENENYTSDHQLTNLVGFGLFGDYDVTADHQTSALGNVAFDGIAPFSSDHQQSASAGNTVGFPDPGRYVDETYVTDTYVDSGFDADMTQRFASRNVFSGLAGYKVVGILDADSDHQSNLAGGLNFEIQETLSTQNIIDLNTSVTQDGDLSINTDSQTSTVGGLALFGLLNSLSQNNIFVDATNEIVPEANLLADAQFETTPGFLLSLGSVQYDADAQFTIDQTAGTTAGLIFDGSASFDSDHILSGLVGLLVRPGTQTFTAQHQINVIAGYLQSLASSIQSDHQTTMVPTILQSAAQAFMQSQHQIDITTGRILFTQFDNASDFQISIVGRRIEAADPYRAIEVPSETRIDIVVQETRIKSISVETRVNTIEQETQLFKVPSETRNLKVLPDSTIKYRTGKVIAERI